MPIVDVEWVADPPESAELAQRLADAVAEALSSRPGGTWVRVHRLDAAAYAEDGGAPPGVRPVFVTVLERERPTGRQLADRVARLTAAVAEVTGRPADTVHVLFEPSAAGRLAFGGHLVAPDDPA